MRRVSRRDRLMRHNGDSRCVVGGRRIFGVDGQDGAQVVAQVQLGVVGDNDLRGVGRVGE